MSDLRKVIPGQPLSIPAGAYNAFVDAAAAHRARVASESAGMAPAPGMWPPGSVMVRNDSGGDLERFSVVGLGEPLIDPSVSLPGFQSRAGFSGVTPTSAHTGRFAVLIAPLAAGKLGGGIVTGVAHVRLDVTDELIMRADVIDGDATKLRTHPRGAAEVLWKAPTSGGGGSGVVWAMVRLGPAPPPMFFPVLVSKTSGSAGDADSPCTFVYTATDLHGVTLGTGLTPARARPSVGIMIQGSGVGLGYLDTTGQFVLWDASETLSVVACE